MVGGPRAARRHSVLRSERRTLRRNRCRAQTRKRCLSYHRKVGPWVMWQRGATADKQRRVTAKNQAVCGVPRLSGEPMTRQRPRSPNGRATRARNK